MKIDPHGCDPEQAAEVARIEAAYRQRDAGDSKLTYRFANPGYAFYMQLLEWSLLDAVRRSPVDLERARVLDVGCGTGYMVNRLIEFGALQATGVDLMAGRVEAARARYPGGRFVRANAAALPFADGEFEMLTQFTCLSSVLDGGLRQAIAAEMWRVLAPGGIVVSYDMLPVSWTIRAMQRLGELRRGTLRGSTPVTSTTGISADELHRLFPAAALSCRSAGLAFGLCRIAERSYTAARLLAYVPLLREHAIGVALKPRDTSDGETAS